MISKGKTHEILPSLQRLAECHRTKVEIPPLRLRPPLTSI